MKLFLELLDKLLFQSISTTGDTSSGIKSLEQEKERKVDFIYKKLRMIPGWKHSFSHSLLSASFISSKISSVSGSYSDTSLIESSQDCSQLPYREDAAAQVGLSSLLPLM